MKDRELFDKLIGRAQEEGHPGVDVANNVLEKIASGHQGQIVSYRPLVWIASVSSTAAACVTVFALLSLKASTAGAMSELYQTISWVVQ